MPLTPPLLPNNFFAIEATPPQGSLFLSSQAPVGHPARRASRLRRLRRRFAPPAPAQPERPAGGSPPVQTRHTKKAAPAESLFLLLFGIVAGIVAGRVFLFHKYDLFLPVFKVNILNENGKLIILCTSVLVYLIALSFIAIGSWLFFQ